MDKLFKKDEISSKLTGLVRRGRVEEHIRNMCFGNQAKLHDALQLRADLIEERVKSSEMDDDEKRMLHDAVQTLINGNNKGFKNELVELLNKLN